jgi:heme exporter protein D
MATWIWIVIAIAVVVVLVLIVLGAMRGRQKQLEQRRDEAQQLRQQAAAEVGARADRIDPDAEAPDQE